MAKLVLIRHGESQWNKENKFTGWVDVPLSEKGESEARRAGEHLKSYQFTRAYTSLLKRAQNTLKLILEVTGQTDLEIIEDKALNERHYGKLQGLDKAETAKKYGDEQVHIWRRSYDIAPPEGESLKDTAARTLPYFRETIMKDVAEGKDIVVAAHGNSLRSIVMELDALSKEEVLQLNIATAVPIVYEIDASRTVISKTILD